MDKVDVSGANWMPIDEVSRAVANGLLDQLHEMIDVFSMEIIWSLALVMGMASLYLWRALGVQQAAEADYDRTVFLSSPLPFCPAFPLNYPNRFLRRHDVDNETRVAVDYNLNTPLQSPTHERTCGKHCYSCYCSLALTPCHQLHQHQQRQKQPSSGQTGQGYHEGNVGQSMGDEACSDRHATNKLHNPKSCSLRARQHVSAPPEHFQTRCFLKGRTEFELWSNEIQANGDKWDILPYYTNNVTTPGCLRNAADQRYINHNQDCGESSSDSTSFTFDNLLSDNRRRPFQTKHSSDIEKTAKERSHSEQKETNRSYQNTDKDCSEPAKTSPPTSSHTKPRADAETQTMEEYSAEPEKPSLLTPNDLVLCYMAVTYCLGKFARISVKDQKVQPEKKGHLECATSGRSETFHQRLEQGMSDTEVIKRPCRSVHTKIARFENVTEGNGHLQETKNQSDSLILPATENEEDNSTAGWADVHSLITGISVSSTEIDQLMEVIAQAETTAIGGGDCERKRRREARKTLVKLKNSLEQCIFQLEKQGTHQLKQMKPLKPEKIGTLKSANYSTKEDVGKPKFKNECKTAGIEMGVVAQRVAAVEINGGATESANPFLKSIGNPTVGQTLYRPLRTAVQTWKRVSFVVPEKQLSNVSFENHSSLTRSEDEPASNLNKCTMTPETAKTNTQDMLATGDSEKGAIHTDDRNQIMSGLSDTQSFQTEGEQRISPAAVQETKPQPRPRKLFRRLQSEQDCETVKDRKGDRLGQLQ